MVLLLTAAAWLTQAVPTSLAADTAAAVDSTAPAAKSTSTDSKPTESAATKRRLEAEKDLTPEQRQEEQMKAHQAKSKHVKGAAKSEAPATPSSDPQTK